MHRKNKVMWHMVVVELLFGRELFVCLFVCVRVPLKVRLAFFFTLIGIEKTRKTRGTLKDVSAA